MIIISKLEIPDDMIDNSRVPINSESKLNSDLQETRDKKVDDDRKNTEIIENNKSTNTDFETASYTNTKNNLSKLNMDSEEESINLEDNQEKALKEVIAEPNTSDTENHSNPTEDTVNTLPESTHKIENDKQVLKESIGQKDEENVTLSAEEEPILNNVEKINQSNNPVPQAVADVKSIEHEPAKDSPRTKENKPSEKNYLEIEEKTDVEQKELKVINIDKVPNSEKPLVNNVEKVINEEDQHITTSVEKSKKELVTVLATDNNKTLEDNIDNVNKVQRQ